MFSVRFFRISGLTPRSPLDEPSPKGAIRGVVRGPGSEASMGCVDCRCQLPIFPLDRFCFLANCPWFDALFSSPFKYTRGGQTTRSKSLDMEGVDVDESVVLPRPSAPRLAHSGPYRQSLTTMTDEFHNARSIPNKTFVAFH